MGVGGAFALGGVPTIAADDMELGPRLGDGTYAVVHAGWWRGAAVAVKILRRSSGDGQQGCQAGYARAVDAFAREAALLSRLQHPNVLALYGVVAPTSQEVPPAAVLELMPHGSLTQSLRARRLPPCTRTAACLALGAARAMQHLHAQSPPVVHFDLKADNLLVDWRDPGQPVCKLSDLGLACTLTPQLASRAQGRGTLWWMAPELFPGAPAQLQCRVGTPLDVFSFGLVLWEIATSGAEPYPPGTPPEVVVDAVRRGLRPAAPLGCDPRWVALMTACWAGDPGARPTFDQVVRHLVALLRG
jgi:serine/threonine protein kinase